MKPETALPPTSSARAADPSTYFPCFQPIVELESGRVAGNEALARCLSASGEVVSAASLFAHDTQPDEWVRGVDRHLRHQALQAQRQWGQGGFIALNISPAWVDKLGDAQVIPTLQMIEELGLDPRQVVIEVTERSGDLANLQRLTRQYQRYGLRVAVDDYGSGASQVDRIIALEPDLIKLDMTLFKAASSGGAAADIALATTAMAMRAGCQIVCEGVETAAEFDFAIECGADLVQGWLFDKALREPADPAVYRQQVQALKAQYLERKSASHHRAFRHQLAVEEQARLIKDGWSNAGGALAPQWSISPRVLHQLGMLRFYWCDEQGTQTSPNYELVPEAVVPEHCYVGSNWSHRPYFPRLMGIRDLPLEQMVVSEAYRDIRSGDMCKTYALRQSDSAVLLLDVLVSDQVLFAR
ncbi:EAL domain-containing protein [Gilvimarinus xylanilyticus]|uniref:EAL domain-containing protein n=1 Tax=Gilvimarinus xylanilyticus TaxID=2944139 RepID=A0A9X2HXK5_9GAMM|nr:EAL domain-containing protein [Gilvimarinus xylanilyticus]MCP8899509.1 EAL domain-containing protein [Gilvimarinus xylanilyticus]